MARYRRGRGALAGLVLIASLAGCGGTTAPQPADQQSVPQGIPVPFSNVPAPVVKPVPAPVLRQPQPQQHLPGGAGYPLTTGQALRLLGAGVPVAGTMPGGAEALATKTIETSYEQKQVLQRQCFDDYDYFAKKNVRRCREDHVYEQVPVEKAVYVVFMDGSHRRYRSPAGAITNIVGFGVANWRRA